MKICFISLDAYPLFSREQQRVQGGAEVDVYMLSTELAKDQRFKVSLVTGDYGQNDVEAFENITIYKTAVLQSPMAAGLSLWRTLRRVDADIYFKKGASLVTTLIALFCRIHHKSFILRTSHKSECDGSYIHSQLLKGWAYRWALRTAKRVFVQNAQDCESLLKTTGVGATAIPNGHRLTSSFGGERKWILWVGRSVAFKRPELFIKLANEFPSEQFVMICQWTKGDKNFNKPVEQNSLVEEIKKAPNLKFIEHVPFHQIDTYFEGAKVFVNTSDVEGFPNTFIQACRCGTPILSLTVNPDDFLNKYKCGLCAKGDWQKFNDMLKYLLDPKAVLEYGTSGRRYVQENHDIQEIIEQYKRAFCDLI